MLGALAEGCKSVAGRGIGEQFRFFISCARKRALITTIYRRAAGIGEWPNARIFYVSDRLTPGGDGSVGPGDKKLL